jgi:ubiquinone/menaquinone biosynthesis C-methylase UbiE
VKAVDRKAHFSPELIQRAAPQRSARIIDVGGGASTLVDALLRAGYARPSVLDLSAAALGKARERLGVAASAVDWIEADVCSAFLPDAAFDVWHDRAVFEQHVTPSGARQSFVYCLCRFVPTASRKAA